MDYDIFREEIATKYPAYGHALWKPSPGGLYHAVEVGDVGFIREGYFHRLFNILLPEDHPSHRDGVPQNHEPLELRMSSPTYAGMLQPNNLCSKGVFMDSDEYGLYALGPDSAQLSFSCTRRQGAILALPLPARYKDTAARGDFAKCITKHIDEWFAFAQECGSGISRREDIILVTGCHLAKSWANIAFQDRHEKVTFGAQVSGGHVEWQFTPEGARGVAFNLGPSGQNLLEDQCIFVRGFRVTRFMGILPRLQGAAGPARIPGDDNPDAAAQIISISVDTHYQDPLHTLLNYIATQAPECDMALVHDDDLLCLAGASLESLGPDAMMNHLQKSAPEIHQVKCDFSSPSHHDKHASKAEAPLPTKVATLSMYPFGAPEDSSTRGASGKTSGRHLKIHVFRRLLKFLASGRTSAKVDLGDRRLDEAHNLARRYKALISPRDLRIAEERFTMTRVMRVELGSRSGISKLLQAREYCKSAKGDLRYVQQVSSQGREQDSDQTLVGTGY